MQKAYRLIFFFIAAAFSLGFADYEMEQPSFINPSQGLPNQPGLMINNRPLAKINGKVISSIQDIVGGLSLRGRMNGVRPSGSQMNTNAKGIELKKFLEQGEN